MTAAKVKKGKSSPKAKLAKALDVNLEKKSWKKVKIKGNVISDDGGGFEGLIGLEVLKDYTPKLVETSLPNKRGRKLRNTGRKQTAKQRKELQSQQANDSDVETDSSGEEDDGSESPPQLSKKKAKSAEHMAKKIAQRREKREKRKEMRKLKANKVGKGNKIGPHNSKTVDKNPSDDNQEYPADRFALLRPPPVTDLSSTDDEAPPLVAVEADDEKHWDIDALQGWNGLGVPQSVLRAMAEKGFNTPTEIQALTLPAAILGKKDILGAAETGSGKTLAFGIPILAGIMELKAKNSYSGIRKVSKSKAQSTAQPTAHPTAPPVKKFKEDRELTPPPEELAYFPRPNHGDDEDDSEDEDGTYAPLYAVILTPTRELAVQVKEHLVAAAKYTGIQIAAIFGGLAVAKQERVLRKCPEIVVATPGRLWELYQQGNKHLSKICDVSFLVIDETDRMVEKGHFEELRSLMKVLNADEQKKQTRQNFVFSATLTLVHDLPEHMQKRNTGKRPKFIKQTPGLKLQSLIEELGISQPKIVDITRTQQTAQTLTECRLICPIDHKDYHLYYFVQRHPGRTIVFCNSIDCVKRLATIFGLLDCNPLPLHANMAQKQRLKNLERFRDNVNGLLIATDVAARGLDIQNVEHVIHYQVPRTSENYVHRSGRTARANKNGITVMFMEPGEVRSYVKLYKTLDRTEDLPLFPISERYLDAVKERVDLAREVDKQELKLRRSQAEIGWMKKHAEEMEMIIDGFNDQSDAEQDEDPFIIERRRDRIHLATVRSELKSLLNKPIFPRGFSFKYPTSTGTLQTPELTVSKGTEHNSAVKVMKDAIEDMKLAKKMRNKKQKLS